jgi:hypothetical protein
MFFDRIARSFENIPLKYWLAFACLSRLILSFTYQSYNHPDEWYQTIEFSNLLWGKKATYSPEIFWHMRNLSWPWILSLVSRLAYAISPHSLFLQTISIQLFCAALDFVAIWSVIKIIDKLDISHKKLWSIFFLTAHFLLKDSTRPSQDHISTIIFYGALALSFYQHWFLAGVLTSLIGATKYASGLLSVGLSIAFFIMFYLKHVSLKNLLKLHFGIVFGILVGGLADYIYYGVFYESMWSYFYFNIYSGLMNKIFGEQTALVFLQYLFSQWKVFHFTFFSIGFLATIKNLFGLFKKNILLLAPLSVLLLGSIFIKHKEGRFITQIEIGLWLTLALALTHSTFNRFTPRILISSIFLNINFCGTNLLGDLNKPTFSYLKLPTLFHQANSPCAAITLKRPLGIFYLDQKVPQAFWHLGKKDDFSSATKNLKLIWFGNHQCKDLDRVLVQTYKQDLNPFQCTEIESMGAKWFDCPSSIIQMFAQQEVRNIFLDQMPSFESPTFSTPSNVMVLRQKDFEQKFNLSIGSMPDL